MTPRNFLLLLISACSLAAATKEELRALTAAALPNHKGAAALQAALTAAVPSAATVEVAAAPGHPGLLAVTYHLNLSAGIESSLTLYRDGQPIFLADPANHELAPPQFTPAAMLLNASHGAAHTLQLIRLADLKPIFHTQFSAEKFELSFDPETLRVEPQLFSHDPARGCCEAFPFRYSIQSVRATRTQPIGFNPRQFLEAFLRAPWPEVAAFTDPAARPKLQRRHAQSAVRASYSEIQPCDGIAKLWQVSVDGESHFLIERTGTWHFRLRDVQPEPNPNCQTGDTYPWLTSMFEKPL